MGQTTSTWFGTKQGDQNTGASAVRSAMSHGYTSYAPIDRCTETFGYTNETAATKTDAEMMSEKSITSKKSTGSPEALQLYDQKLRENIHNGCGPEVVVAIGSMDALTTPGEHVQEHELHMSGGTRRSRRLQVLYPRHAVRQHDQQRPQRVLRWVRCRGLPDYQVPHWRDLAQYKSLVMTSTLDITNVGENTTVRSAWVEWRNGTTVDFIEHPDTTNLAGTKLHFVSPGSGEDEIVLKFAPYYSTGKYERDVAAVKEEFEYPASIRTIVQPAWITASRDITGYEGGFQSKALGREIKKLGNGGLSTLPTQHASKSSFYPNATSTPKSTKEELMSLGGAPKLEVTEVRPSQNLPSQARRLHRPSSQPRRRRHERQKHVAQRSR